MLEQFIPAAVLAALVSALTALLTGRLQTATAQRREERRALGRTIEELLRVRLLVVTMPAELKRLENDLPAHKAQLAEARPILLGILRDGLGDVDPTLIAGALDCIAESAPVLAFELRAKLRVDVFRSIFDDTAAAMAELDLADAARALLDPALKEGLDRALQELAKRHGRATLKAVRTKLQRFDEETPEYKTWVHQVKWKLALSGGSTTDSDEASTSSAV